MQLYRSKPAQVKAMLFAPTTVDAAKEAAGGAVVYHGSEYWVETLEGWVRLPFGHYLICGMKGEWYPCDPEVFANRWELADA